jgi:hypothetical protein
MFILVSAVISALKDQQSAEDWVHRLRGVADVVERVSKAGSRVAIILSISECNWIDG